jgi:hypothetical protein
MVNNSTNINKTNNYLSPQIIEHKNDSVGIDWKGICTRGLIGRESVQAFYCLFISEILLEIQ